MHESGSSSMMPVDAQSAERDDHIIIINSQEEEELRYIFIRSRLYGITCCHERTVIGNVLRLVSAVMMIASLYFLQNYL